MPTGIIHNTKLFIFLIKKKKMTKDSEQFHLSVKYKWD